MLQHIADQSLEKDLDRAAAHLALFALGACLAPAVDSTPGLRSYMLLPDKSPLSQHEAAARLAQYPKPVWLHGHRTHDSIQVEIGPLATKLLMKRLYDSGHNLRSRQPPEYPSSHPDDIILCYTESLGIRVRQRAFDHYQRDYMLEPPCVYAGGPIGGRYRTPIDLESSELEGVAAVMRIGSGGHGVIWIAANDHTG